MNTLQEQIEDIAARVAKLERKGLNQGEFRLLFTFQERVAETAFLRSAEALVSAGDTSATGYTEALAYLTMIADFRDAGEIFLNDPAVAAALDFYVVWGILTQARRDEILTLATPV